MNRTIHTIIAFVALMAVMRVFFVINSDEAFGFTVTIIAIAVVSDMIRKRFEQKSSQKEQAQMQADLNDLKKSVDEMKEYITDLYIQEHDQRLKENLSARM